MNIFKKIINIKGWKRSTKAAAIVIMAALAVVIVLYALKPTQQEMIESASQKVQTALDKDAASDSDRNYVTTTYNSLIVVNYVSFVQSKGDKFEESYVGFAGHIYDAESGVASIIGKFVNYTYRMLGCGQSFLYGIKLTMVLTTLSMVIGFILSIFLALGKISKNLLISKLCSAYIFFFRGTPLLIQLLFIYYAMPTMLGFAWKSFFPGDPMEGVFKGAFIAALISFSLNAAAYCAEIVRAAIQSIDKGQHEASKALGMTYGQTMRMIVIPQSIRRMVPPLCNEFVMMIKDVSLVFAISLMDITTISKSISSSSGDFLVFIPALAIYLVITAVFTFIFNKVEQRLSIYE